MSSLTEIISYGHVESRLMHPHCNPGMEIILVDQGHLEWAVEQVPEVLNPGTVFFTLPWQKHGSLQVQEPRNRIFYILFSLPGKNDVLKAEMRFPEALKFSAAEQQMLAQVFMKAPHHAWQASSLFKRLFPELIQRLAGTTAMDSLSAISLLRSILIELADTISKSQSTQQHPSPTVRKVRSFLREIGQALDHAWTLEEMATRCGVKRTQLSKIIKQVTGYPPIQYLNRIRLEKACEILRNTDRSITDIAFDCGYGSSQYFAENFKKHLRMTPTEYRILLPDLDAILKSNWEYPEQRSIAEEKKRAAVFGQIS